jgi:hypothetical protein
MKTRHRSHTSTLFEVAAALLKMDGTNLKRRTPLLISGFMFLAAIPSAFATTLISNLPGQDNPDYNLSVGNGITYGEGFTMPDVAFILNSVTLDMNLNGNTSPVIQLWSDNSSNLPGSVLLTFTNPSYNPNSTQILPYNFTAPTTFTLQANTIYWLVAGTDNNNSVFWNSDPGNGTTPTGAATYFGNENGLGSSTSQIASYSVDGTAVVPEPSGFFFWSIALFFTCASVGRRLRPSRNR